MAKVPTIENFTFIKPISRGAFGKVFLGHKKGQPEQVYAIKVMKKSDMINKNLTSQVVTERDAMAKVSSPFVVKLFYSMQSQQNIFLVMEYMIGGDVKSLLGVAGYFEQSMAVTYVAEVTLALEYLHCKRIIHRDLKPDNMLISDRGHIKLTDFGLSKFNMCFADVPMTPKTPMPYFNRNYEMYRTPGQILSLSCHLGFSSECVEDRSPLPLSPLAELSMNIQDRATTYSYSHNITPASGRAQCKQRPATPHIPSNRQARHKSLHDVLLSQSTSNYIKTMHVSTPGRDSGPVSSLTSTLEASLNWTNSMSDDYLSSSVNIDELSSISNVNRAMSLSLCGGHSLEGRSKQQSDCTSLSVEQLHDSADCVFETDGQSCSGVSGLVDQCHCDCRQGHCSECLSHSKVPSRQEKVTDDTPQMHRTDESVWSSYAARNLRSLRHGSYSEDSDAELGESNYYFFKENMLPCRALAQRPVCVSLSGSELNLPRESKRTTKHKPRRLIKAKSFSHPSDEECEPKSNRYNSQVQFAKKRGFCDVDQSPVRRTKSAESGLTQEFSLLRCASGEPLYKRSISLPRTRIRFHSGVDQPAENMATKVPSSESVLLSNLATDYKQLSNMDNMLTLSADEPRLQEGHSDTSLSGSDRHSSSNSACRNRSGDYQNACFDKVCTNGTDEMAASQDTKPVNRLLRRPQNKPVVSSLKSDTDGVMTSLNVSSIHEDSTCNVSQQLDLDRSVFHADSPTQQNEDKRSLGVQPSFKTATLLPPPPPRNRRLTGKKTPGKLTFASVATCFPPAVYRHSGSSCSSLEISSTAIHASAHEVQCPLNSQYQRTPNQYQTGIRESHSVVLANMTPYRTPKSVRRAPPPKEQERILGTPDYLAPEILNQQPHGPAVDWWALGVCMFEFLTGVPPFNDHTPELVFNNILNRDIPWPEGEEAISEECKEAIEALLTVDPKERPGARAIRRMRAFEPIAWQTLLDIDAPWVPEPENNEDTTYFEARNMMQDLLVSDVDF